MKAMPARKISKNADALFLISFALSSKVCLSSFISLFVVMLCLVSIVRGLHHQTQVSGNMGQSRRSPEPFKQGDEKAVVKTCLTQTFSKIFNSTYFNRLNPLRGILDLFRNVLGGSVRSVYNSSHFHVIAANTSTLSRALRDRW